MLRLKAFRAIDFPELSQKYVNGHQDVLKIYGITEITSAKDDWYNNPSTYAIVAIDEETQEVVGGIRMQIVGGDRPLPIEDAVGHMDDRIHDIVNTQHALFGAAELCGLWNSRKVAGQGVSWLLTRTGIALASQMNVRTLFGICSMVTLPMFQKTGYVVERSIGKDGTFYYPNSDLLAYTIVMDAELLDTALKEEKNKILKIRADFTHRTIESNAKAVLDVQYDLIVHQAELVEV
ncbi:MAG: hypothetical protein ACI865_001721 [Flavobacteriaceae bacterium]|jgi:hypothetical protein